HPLRNEMAVTLPLPVRRVVGVLVALGIALPGQFGALPGQSAEGVASDAEQPDLRLSITLTSDAEALSDGDDPTYTAEIRNDGAAIGARVVLTPPEYITLSAAEGAVLDANVATWTRALPAGSTTTLEIDATVGEIPADEVRATALAGVHVGDAESPVIRTA